MKLPLDYNLERQIADHKARGRNKPLLMAHVVLGYPSFKESIEFVKILEQSGASIIELQIPFSDPIADGSTIMYANEVAFQQGITSKDCLKALESLRYQTKIALLLMSYLNPIYSFPDGGVEGFFQQASDAGAEGMIIADLPSDEPTLQVQSISQKNDISLINILSPATPKDRIKKICKLSKTGFLYCTATTGTTGARKELDENLFPYLELIRSQSTIPLAVGFGISTKEQFEALGGYAEIAIVGSATIDVMRSFDKKNRIIKAAKFIQSIVN